MGTTRFSGPVISDNGFIGGVTGALSGVTPLTDNSGGTASNTIAAQSGSYVQATQQNTIATLAAKINEVISALS